MSTTPTPEPTFTRHCVDIRSTDDRFAHSMPVHGQQFVKALGMSGHKFGTCIGIDIRLAPNGALRNWRACISDGMETATHISTGDDWTWNEWHSITDDAMVRQSLDELDAAKKIAREEALTRPGSGLVMPKQEAKPEEAAKPAAAPAKPRPTAPQA